MQRKFERRLSKEKSVGKIDVGSSNGSGESGVLSHKQALEKMKSDWNAKNRSVSVMRVYMDLTREKRREEVNRTNTANLIKRYPALRLQELVR